MLKIPLKINQSHDWNNELSICRVNIDHDAHDLARFLCGDPFAGCNGQGSAKPYLSDRRTDRGGST